MAGFLDTYHRIRRLGHQCPVWSSQANHQARSLHIWRFKSIHDSGLESITNHFIVWLWSRTCVVVPIGGNCLTLWAHIDDLLMPDHEGGSD